MLADLEKINDGIHEFSWTSAAFRIGRKTLLLAGFVGALYAARGQAVVPDAQVESNVLKALATAPELASDSITTRTVYGTVTLSGTVHNEQARDKAETLAANADGVKKVIDELRLGSTPSPAAPQGSVQGAPPIVLLSDGTYGPAPATDGQTVAAGPATAAQKPTPGSAPADQAQRNNPDADQQLDLQREQQPVAAPGQPVPTPSVQSAPVGNPQYSQRPYPPAYPGGQYPGAQSGSAQSATYPASPYPRPMYYPGYPQYSNGAAPSPQPGQYAPVGQPAGQQVVVPTGTLLRVRINRPLASNRTQPGTPFDGIVVNDVVAGGFVAIPRGASVQGTVLDAKSSGALTGRGEMSIQLQSVTLGGRTFPLVSDVWAHNGGDKTIETVNKTAGFGAAGAVIGALAGGGVGAAVGGGIGAAAGLGSSAASGHGQVYLPSEAVVTFHTAQDTPVATVSQQEMQRLAYGVPPGADQRPVQRPYPPVYVGPGYYPGYYPYYPYRPY